jgi:hypothetical protein
VNSRLYHSSWGGLFAHPVLDRDIFECLPYIRQREILAATYGGEVPDLSYIPPVPFWFFCTIPDSLPLTFLVQQKVDYERRNVMERLDTLTIEQVEGILSVLAEHVTLQKLIAACTVRGRGESIKTNKPSDGVYAYVWRMARFNDGSDVCMPVTAFFDLEKGINEITGIPASFTFIREGQQKAICDWLDKWSQELVKRVGGDPLAGTLRWGRVLGMVR